MVLERVDTLVVGGGQAGLAMSEHLSKHRQQHLVVERNRIAERWRSERWDSLVANGPAWHDRFPGRKFSGDQDGFASKDQIVDYFVEYSKQIEAPIRCGVEVLALSKPAAGTVFHAQTPRGTIEAKRVIVATGPFQRPIIPDLVATPGVKQMHSAHYRNPSQLAEGAVLVVGAGSSGVQIADELARSGRRVFLSVGPHNRPPRRYRGRDFVYWLGVLGEWDTKVLTPGTEHVTIAVSGARGGHTVDFRELASLGITLLGTTTGCHEGVLSFAPDLAKNIGNGDSDYLSVLDRADAYVAANGLDFPLDPDARELGPLPYGVTHPLQSLDIARSGIASIVWATGYALDFDWIKIQSAFDSNGRPQHERGVSTTVEGLYFLGLSWLSRRASAFIWGVWHDADFLANHISSAR